MIPPRYGMTVPCDGVPRHEHRRCFEELVDLGFTDTWSGGDDLVVHGRQELAPSLYDLAPR